MNVMRLFIGDREVEFTESPAINYNWTETDVTNPTVTKVGFSKTIRIPGTKSNNDLFGHFWNLERTQRYGSYELGVDFNPTSRVPFTLYYNDSIFETGYVKLQNVTRKEGGYEYEVGLFGGLASFLYGLSVNSDGSKKTLADLSYYAGDREINLDFIINRETVMEAWTAIGDSTSKWSTLNFSPGYVGIPDKLDADKVLINFSGMGSEALEVLPSAVPGYMSYNGYALGKLDNKIDQWAAKDLRSYLNIPVIRCKSVIDAISRDAESAGYELVLDPDFFNSENPAFEDSWMTLPRMTTLNFSYSGSSTPVEPIDTYTVSRNTSYKNSDGNYVYATTLDYILPSATQTMGITASLDLNMYVKVSRDSEKPTDRTLYLNNGRIFAGGRTLYVQYGPRNGIAIQLVAFDENDVAIGGSDITWCEGTNYTEDRYHLTDAPNFNFADAHYNPYVNASSVPFSGDFDFVSSTSSYCLFSYPKIPLSFYVPIGTKKISVDIQFVPDNREYPARLNGTYSTPRKGNELYNNYNSVGDLDYFWAGFDNTTSGELSLSEQGNVNNFFSNRKVLKSELMNTSYSAAEWLMSYCKLHGLYIVKDPGEMKVSILTRPNFYHEGVEDISKLVDIMQDVDIKPVYVDNKFLTMTLPIQENAYSKAYKNKYKYEYGEKVVDTGYDFETSPKELLDKVKFKAAVPVNKQSLYYFKPKSGLNPYVYNGLEYNLYQSGNISGQTQSVEVKKDEISKIYDGYSYTPGLPAFDLYYKMYFENEDKGIATENVLLFYNGKKTVTDCGYYITDDTTMMNTMNNNPCWILTTSISDELYNQIATKVDTLPSFTSMYFDPETGNLKRSAYFASPRELYTAPGEVTFNSKSTLYEWYYSRYFADLYDVNTKVVTAFVKPKGVLSEDHLRRFYWFENSIWRINKIVDYTPGSNDPVKVEFVKVQDMQNYLTVGFKTPKVISIDLDFVAAEKITPAISATPGAITIEALSTSAVTATSDSLSPIVFTSSDTGIATVTGGGASGTTTASVSGVSSGNTVVTATVPENPIYKSGSTTVNVTVVPIQGSISISPNPLNAHVGEETLFSVRKNSPAAPQWSSSNTSVAEVEGGIVRGISAGNCTVTANLPAVPGVYTSATTTASVVVKKRPVVESISLSFVPAEKVTPSLSVPSSTTTNALGTVSITGTSNSSGNIRFASADTSKATVSFTPGSGTCVCNISGISSGNTVIYVYVDEDPIYKSGSTACNVTVTPNTSTLTLSPSPASVHVGGTRRITANTNSTGVVTWSSSSPSITVDSNGVVTGVAAGQATITANLAAVPGVWTSATATATVTSTSIPSVSSISLTFEGASKTTPTISMPSSVSLTAFGTTGVTATSNSGSAIKFISSSTDIATVTSTPAQGSCQATVSGVSSGTTTITAYVEANALYESASTTCRVSVSPVTATASVSPSQSTLRVGDILELTGTTNSSARPTWSSSSTSVATVTANGTVTAMGTGTATITYTVPAVSGKYTSASASCTVTVIAALKTPVVSSISLTFSGGEKTAPTLTISTGSTTLNAVSTKTISATSNSSANISFSSSNSSIASVSSTPASGSANCTVSGVSSGTTTITAYVPETSVYTSASTTCSVSVTPNTTTLTVSPSPASVTKNNTVTLTGTTNSPCGVTWSSSSTSVATVNSNGVVTGVAPGETTIHAEVPAYAGKYTSASADTTLTVSDNPSPTVTITPASSTVPALSTKQLTGTTNSSASIQWSSSSTSVATVSSGGLVSGVSSGTTTITAYVPEVPGTWAPASATATVTVTPITGTVTVSPGSASVAIGSTTTLTASKNSTASVQWSSSNTSVATVNSNGVVTGVSAGSVTITASVPAVPGVYTAASGTATIKVLKTPSVQSISLTSE